MLPNFGKPTRKRKNAGDRVATVKSVYFSRMALCWNQLVLVAYSDEQGLVKYGDFTAPVDKFSYKDADNLKTHGTKYVPKAIQAAQSKGDTFELRKDFDKKSKALNGRRRFIHTLHHALWQRPRLLPRYLHH